MGHCGVVSRQRRSVFGLRQRDDLCPAHVGMQRAALNKHAAPDNLARLADALQRSAAERKSTWPAALAAGARIAADKMIGGAAPEICSSQTKSSMPSPL
jgi:hypothetical protein